MGPSLKLYLKTYTICLFVTINVILQNCNTFKLRLLKRLLFTVCHQEQKTPLNNLMKVVFKLYLKTYTISLFVTLNVILQNCNNFKLRLLKRLLFTVCHQEQKTPLNNLMKVVFVTLCQVCTHISL